MAHLYWIHKETDTDIFTEGYIGITSRPPVWRWLKHLSDARKNNPKYTVHRAMQKYSDCIRFTILCEGAFEGACAYRKYLESLSSEELSSLKNNS